MTKDLDEQPDAETHRVRSIRVLNQGASIRVEVGCALPVRGWVQQPAALKLTLSGLLWRFHCVGMIDH